MKSILGHIKIVKFPKFKKNITFQIMADSFLLLLTVGLHCLPIDPSDFPADFRPDYTPIPYFLVFLFKF